jgi:hypothetical protein
MACIGADTCGALLTIITQIFRAFPATQKSHQCRAALAGNEAKTRLDVVSKNGNVRLWDESTHLGA